MKIVVLLLLILQTLWMSYITAITPDRSIATRIFVWLLFASPSVAAFAYIIAT